MPVYEYIEMAKQLKEPNFNFNTSERGHMQIKLKSITSEHARVKLSSAMSSYKRSFSPYKSSQNDNVQPDFKIVTDNIVFEVSAKPKADKVQHKNGSLR